MSARKANRQAMRALLLIAAWYVLDQATKWWILEHVMKPPRAIEITSFFNVVLGRNTGVSFGLLTGVALPPGHWLSFRSAWRFFCWCGLAEQQTRSS